MVTVVNKFNRGIYRFTCKAAILAAAMMALGFIWLIHYTGDAIDSGLLLKSVRLSVIVGALLLVVFICIVLIVSVAVYDGTTCSKLSLAYCVCGNKIWIDNEDGMYVFGEDRYQVVFSPKVLISDEVDQVTLVIGQWSYKILIPTRGITIPIVD